jgi:predicted  nucleic acid-binding Zn-ribbon protein
MAGTTRSRKDPNIDTMMSEILVALDHIREHMPNGELKDIQKRIQYIEESQSELKEDLRSIKKQMLDPEDGLVVRVNKNTAFRKAKEADEDYYDTIVQEHKELMSWKDGVSRALWIIFTAIAGIIVSMVVRSNP